jgi:ferredoxin
MRVFVDRDRCETHAQCVLAAPEVFRLDENGELEFAATPDDSLREVVEEAVEICPTQAIRLES